MPSSVTTSLAICWYWSNLKYKKKYLKLSQRGGFNIPNQPKKTQSWFFMPFILSSFTDVVVEFTEPIYKSCDDLNIKNLEEKYNKLFGGKSNNLKLYTYLVIITLIFVILVIYFYFFSNH